MYLYALPNDDDDDDDDDDLFSTWIVGWVERKKKNLQS